MGDGEKLKVEQGYLDAYFAVSEDQLDEGFLELFAKPERGEEDSDLFRLEALRKDLVAKNTEKVIEFIASRSPGGGSLRRKMGNVSVSEAGIRILLGREWPNHVIHVWLKMELNGSGDGRPPDIKNYVHAGLQDACIALEAALGLEDKPSSAILSILATAEPGLFSTLREAWELAARPRPERHLRKEDGLWEKLPENWKFGEPLTMSHMAMGINLHSIVGSLYASEDTQRVFSITVQDEARKAYSDQSIVPSYGEWGGTLRFLSPRRGAYYSPRSHELGILLMLGSWVRLLSDSTDRLEADTLEEILAKPGKRFWLSLKWYFKEPIRLRNLHRGVKEWQVTVEKAKRHLSVLRRIRGDRSVYSGIEVPAHFYPTASFGEQESVQEGQVQSISKKAQDQVETLAGEITALVGLTNDEVTVDNSVRQSLVSVMLAILTLVLLVFAVIVAISDIQALMGWLHDRLTRLAG